LPHRHVCFLASRDSVNSNPKISRISDYLIIRMHRADVADKDGLVLYTLVPRVMLVLHTLVAYTLVAQTGSLFVVPVGKETDGREGDRDGKSSWLSRKRERKDRDALGISVHTHASKFVYMYKCIHIYHTHINTYIHKYIYTSTYIYIHIYVYMYACACEYLPTYTHIQDNFHEKVLNLVRELLYLLNLYSTRKAQHSGSLSLCRGD